jgi:FixJ family two-component response regulator
MVSKDSNIVLVVDDDQGMLKAVQRLLRLHAYETHPVFLRRAIQKLPRCRRGSLRHPRHQPARWIRDRAETRSQDAGITVPVIYMTGNEDPALRKVALNSGCIAFLTKPFSAQELIEPLHRAAAGSP